MTNADIVEVYGCFTDTKTGNSVGPAQGLTREQAEATLLAVRDYYAQWLAQQADKLQ
jgi:hypothetical protein